LSFQIENLRARFRIKIRRGKPGLQIRHESRPKSKKHEPHPINVTALSRQVLRPLMYRNRPTM
jgi:hypothetical protein